MRYSRNVRQLSEPFHFKPTVVLYRWKRATLAALSVWLRVVQTTESLAFRQ
jgi:hypothetical protein